MISTQCGIKTCFVRPIIMVGVIACLCFSVGEGLRLRPFPVSAIEESEATNTQLYATAPRDTSLCKYGPLDIPARVQTRGKRQVLDYGSPASQISRELTAHQLLLLEADETVDIVSLLFGSHAPGRALGIAVATIAAIFFTARTVVPYLLHPSPETTIQAEDILVLLGGAGQIDRAIEEINGVCEGVS